MADSGDEPPITKLTRSKQRWAREGRFLTGKTSRPEEQRLPPGQHLTRDWPTLDLGLTPNISRRALAPGRLWRGRNSDLLEFRAVHGAATRPSSPPTSIASPHGRLRQPVGRVATHDLLMACQPRDQARYVVLHSHDGYTSNLKLEDFAAEDALLAHSWSAYRWSRNMAARCGWWCRICISGRARSGCRASNF